MHRHRRPVVKPPLRYLLASSLLAILATAPAYGGQGVISANLHRLECSQADALPTTLANNADVDLISYHTIGNATETTCVVNRVMGSQSPAVPSYNKPKIVSSDGGIWTNAMAAGWLNTVAPGGAGAANREHYEHYERFFQRPDCLANGGPGEDSLSCVPNNSNQNAACNAFAFPMEGEAVSSSAHLPQCTVGTSSATLRAKLGNRASALTPNGRLERVNRELRWQTGGPWITLMGYSWMGALTGHRFDIDGYLNALHNSGGHGINLTRVWAIEQWTALQVDCSSNCTPKGLTPFVGDKATSTSYDLDAPNPEFYARLREFAQKASDRGIVVQLSLFDKHGLIRRYQAGRWLDSPYRGANNQEPYLPNVLNPDNRPHPSFVNWNHAIGSDHRAYLRRVAEEVGGIGNLIFEIINEARVVDWPDDADAGTMSEMEEWQILVTGELRDNLPTVVVRDAFNDETDLTPLHQKVADSGQQWTAQNAMVDTATGTGTRYTLGKVVPLGDGSSSMNGELPINLAGQKRVSVSADLSRTNGWVRIGLKNASVQLVAQFNGSKVFLRTISGGVTTLATYTPSPAVTTPHVRLTADLVAGTASVYVDSEKVLDQVAFATPGSVPVFNSAVLTGSIGSGVYSPSQASVDNFRVDAYDLQ